MNRRDIRDKRNFVIGYIQEGHADSMAYHLRGGNLVGTPNFASVNSHLGDTLSRRDDLESLAYVLLPVFLSGCGSE